eukprot:6264767-Pyramimonas_sp.AAC.3
MIGSRGCFPLRDWSVRWPPARTKGVWALTCTAGAMACARQLLPPSLVCRTTVPSENDDCAPNPVSAGGSAGGSAGYILGVSK